jgi:hypothetical protein
MQLQLMIKNQDKSTHTKIAKFSECEVVNHTSFKRLAELEAISAN